MEEETQVVADTTTETEAQVVEPQIDVSDESKGSEAVENTDERPDVNVPLSKVIEERKKRQALETQVAQLSQEKARLEAAQIQQELIQPSESNFDEETTSFVKRVFAEEREREKVAEFVAKNADKLADPVIRGAVKEIIAEARSAGQYIDQSEALRLAESQIDSRLSKKVSEAKATGEKEGLEIATKKEQMGGIGTTAGKTEVDPSKLSSKEFAEYYQLKRAN